MRAFSFEQANSIHLFTIQGMRPIKSFSKVMIVICFLIVLSNTIFTEVVLGEEGEATENRTVVFELFTETWCGPCKNADLATDEIREQYPDDEVVILEYHFEQGNDPFFTDETNYRFNRYYDFDSWPSAMVDGVLEDVGSGSVKDVKERYQDRIEERLTEKSHFSINILEPRSLPEK